MGIVRVVSIILFIQLNLLVHELSHALLMYQHNIPIKKISIGINVPIITTSFTLSSGIEVTLSPVFFGAYVEPTQDGHEKLKMLGYFDQVAIYGAGVWGNFLLAIFIFIIGNASVSIIRKNTPSMIIFFLCFIVFVPLVAFVLAVHHFISGVVFPLAGAAVLYLVLSSLFLRNSQLVGPIGIVREGVAQSKSNNFINQLPFFILVPVSIGLFNLIPLLPFDGGRVVLSLIEPLGSFAIQLYSIISIFMVGFIVIFIFSSDTAALLKNLFKRTSGQ